MPDMGIFSATCNGVMSNHPATDVECCLSVNSHVQLLLLVYIFTIFDLPLFLLCMGSDCHMTVSNLMTMHATNEQCTISCFIFRTFIFYPHPIVSDCFHKEMQMEQIMPAVWMVIIMCFL
jgi:hypothetical protein